MGDLFSEIFSFNYDSRVFRTLVPLVSKPGFLTVEYNAGHRVRYVPPVRLFIIISILYFFTLSVSGLQGKDINISINESEAAGEVDTSSVIILPEVEDAATEANGSDENSELETYIVNKLKLAAENRDDIISIIYRWLPRLMFILIPVFALLLKFSFKGNGYYYLQHLVFGLHFHSFAFLLALLLMPLSAFNGDWSSYLLLGTIAVYLFIAMRRVYSETTGKTAFKFVLLGGSYVTVYTLSTFTVMIGTILLYE